MSSHSLADFLRRKRSPLVVYLELTHRCSFLCLHCYIPENLRRPLKAKQSSSTLSTAEVLQLLDQLAAAGTLFLVLTGGEIFLRPDLEEILAHASKLGFAIKLFTNGFHITARWAAKLSHHGVYSVEISMYGASEATYQHVTKVKGGLARVAKAALHLRRAGVRLTLKTPVLRENYLEIPRLQRFAKRHGATFRFDLVLVPRFDGDEAPYAHRLNDQQLETLLASLQADFSQTPEQTEGLPGSCAVGRWTAVVAPNGDVLPCIELRTRIGNVLQQDFLTIWNTNPYLQQIRERLAAMPADGQTFGDGLCGHCPAFSEKTVGDMLKPSREHRRIAAVKRKFASRQGCDRMEHHEKEK